MLLSFGQPSLHRSRLSIFQHLASTFASGARRREGWTPVRAETRLSCGSVHASPPTKAARHDNPQLRAHSEDADMTQDQLRNLERARRKALWALASLHLGDPEASDHLAILDHLNDQQQNDTPSTDTPLGLKQVRDSVLVQHHRCGIDIVLEHDIPQPWRERFLQASIGSTRITDGLYATDWDKFLATWEQEMAHVHEHRAARHKPIGVSESQEGGRGAWSTNVLQCNSTPWPSVTKP